MGDRGVGLATLLFGGALLALTLQLPESMLGDPMGPRLWPAVLAVTFLLLGVALFVSGRGWRPGRAQGAPDPRALDNRLRFWGVVAITILYPALLTPLGYLVATALALLALLAIYNPGRWLTNGAVAVGFSAASYLLFHRLLGVYMPSGLLG